MQQLNIQILYKNHIKRCTYFKTIRKINLKKNLINHFYRYVKLYIIKFIEFANFKVFILTYILIS